MTAQDYAREICGDGKKPNKYFITLGYGCYMPELKEGEDSDMIVLQEAVETTTILAGDNREVATLLYNAFAHTFFAKPRIGPHDLTQVTLEDRSGVRLESRYRAVSKGYKVERF